jgi:hypothetical protein
MSDINDNKGKTQPNKYKKTNVIEFKCPEKVDYDVAMLDDFLRAVFSRINADENILTWEVSPNRNPAYPINANELLTRLEKRTLPKAYYFGTSTCEKSFDGRLYNRKNLFQSLYVVILDDIGTKVPIEKLKDITPSFIIESSYENYQYGFILEKPIRNLDYAMGFIKAIYNSGFSDEGGAMPTKLVRLPCGVNGKAGPKEGFLVRLKAFNPEVKWGYDALLDALNVPHTYEQICNDPELFKTSRTAGTTPWMAPNAIGESAKGVVDPLLEQLYASNKVFQDNGVWVDIVCPWGELHSDDNILAGYKPLGRGDNPHERGFHCFHAHCKNHKTNEFLEHASEEYNIEVSRVDYAAELLRNYVFDEGGNGVWNLRNPNAPQFLKTSAFKESFSQSCRLHKPNGKTYNVKQHVLWTASPMRMTVSGTKPFIGRSDLFIQEGPNTFLNTFTLPGWGDGHYDDSEVDRFQKYVGYLIPRTEDYVYFINWLAAKIQNLEFRGAAIVMVAEMQGTGRTTLGNMIETLIGWPNVANVRFDKLLAPSEFNEWASKSLIISNETLATSVRLPQYEKAYEALKEFIDTGNKWVEINPKFGHKFMHNMTCSFLMFSNHRNALSLPAEDRRIYVIENAQTPESPEFFIAHNEWLNHLDVDGLPKWARHVYRWLQDVDVDLTMLNAPPKVSVAKAAMQVEASSGFDTLVKCTLAIMEHPVVNIKLLLDIMTPFIHRVSSMPTSEALLILRKLLLVETLPFTDRNAIARIRIDGERLQLRPRFIKSKLTEYPDWGKTLHRRVIPETTRAEIKEQVTEFYENMEKYKTLLDQVLGEQDF